MEIVIKWQIIGYRRVLRHCITWTKRSQRIMCTYFRIYIRFVFFLSITCCCRLSWIILASDKCVLCVPFELHALSLLFSVRMCVRASADGRANDQGPMLKVDAATITVRLLTGQQLLPRLNSFVGPRVRRLNRACMKTDICPLASAWKGAVLSGDSSMRTCYSRPINNLHLVVCVRVYGKS